MCASKPAILLKWHILRRIFYKILTYIAYNLLPYWKYVHTYQKQWQNILGTNFFKGSDACFHEFHTLLENVPKVLSLSPASAVNDSTN